MCVTFHVSTCPISKNYRFKMDIYRNCVLFSLTPLFVRPFIMLTECVHTKNLLKKDPMENKKDI